MDFFGILSDMKNGSKVPYSKSYFDTLFAAKLAEMQIKTITGVLPLTFTAKGGTAVDWVIEGNDDNGTENLFDGTFLQGYWGFVDGTLTKNNPYWITTNKIPCESNKAYTFSFGRKSRYYGFVWFDSNGDFISSNDKTSSSDEEYRKFTATSPETAAYVVVNIAGKEGYNNQITPTDIIDMMLVKGSTAPDHYIPYQQGVGERTENLFDKDGATNGNYITINGDLPSADHSHTDFIEIVGGEDYYLSHAVGINSFYTGVQYDTSKQAIGYFSISGSFDASGSVTFSENAKYIKINYRTSITNNMLIKGSTAPTTYIPYGYQIPLAVLRQGQPDKTYDIYIGDSPLTEGETVSKSSTGVDIELFEGSNTVDTTLYNKPDMEIKYK